MASTSDALALTSQLRLRPPREAGEYGTDVNAPKWASRTARLRCATAGPLTAEPEGDNHSMTPLHAARRPAVAGLLATVALGTLAVAASTASASVSAGSAATRPSAVMSFNRNIRCGGDVCVVPLPATPRPSELIFYAANGRAFRGHFRVLGPDHYSSTSPTRTWPAHGIYHSVPSAWDSKVLHPHKGYYCVTGYRTNGQKVGRACAHNS